MPRASWPRPFPLQLAESSRALRPPPTRRARALIHQRHQRALVLSHRVRSRFVGRGRRRRRRLDPFVSFEFERGFRHRARVRLAASTTASSSSSSSPSRASSPSRMVGLVARRRVRAEKLEVGVNNPPAAGDDNQRFRRRLTRRDSYAQTRSRRAAWSSSPRAYVCVHASRTAGVHGASRRRRALSSRLQELLRACTSRRTCASCTPYGEMSRAEILQHGHERVEIPQTCHRDAHRRHHRARVSASKPGDSYRCSSGTSETTRRVRSRPGRSRSREKNAFPAASIASSDARRAPTCACRARPRPP